MRTSCLAWRRLVALSLLGALAAGCAQSGVLDEELDGDGLDEDDGDARRDAGKAGGRDAGGRSSDEDDDARSDAGASSRRDAGSSKPRDAGAGSSLPSITCPSSMICTSDVSLFLSFVAPTVTAGTALCAQSGVLPMLVRCQTTDECEAADLPSSTCSSGVCIQACTK
jgi:hypothetical protein